MSPFPVKNLNLLLPKDGIKEKMIPHADLILSRPWNPMERKNLGSRVWVRVRGGARAQAELGTGRVRERVGRRESDLNAVGLNPTNSG